MHRPQHSRCKSLIRDLPESESERQTSTPPSTGAPSTPPFPRSKPLDVQRQNRLQVYESSRAKQIQFAFDRYAEKGGEAIFTILVSKRNFSTWSHLLDELSRKCHAAVHKVFTCGEHSLVADAGELTEGELYICTAGRRPKLDPDTERTQQTAALVRASARFARRFDLGSVGIAQTLAKRKMASKVQTRTITVFGNGLSDDVGHKVVLNKRTAPSFDKVLTLVSKLIPLRGGVRKLYTLPDCKLVRNLEQLQASKAAEFVAVGLKSLNKLLLPKHGDGSSGGSSEPPKPKQARRPGPKGKNRLSPLDGGGGNGASFPQSEPVRELSGSDQPSSGHLARPPRSPRVKGKAHAVLPGISKAAQDEHANQVIDTADEVGKIKNLERDRQRRTHQERLRARVAGRAKHDVKAETVTAGAGAVDNKVDEERKRQSALLRKKIGQKRATQIEMRSLSQEQAATTIQTHWKAHKARKTRGGKGQKSKSPARARDAGKSRWRDPSVRVDKPKVASRRKADAGGKATPETGGVESPPKASKNPLYNEWIYAERVPTPDLSFTQQERDAVEVKAALTIQASYRGFVSRKKHNYGKKPEPVPEPSPAARDGADFAEPAPPRSKKAERTEKKKEKRRKKENNKAKAKKVDPREVTSPTTMMREESRFSMRGIEDFRIVEERYEIGEAIGDGNFAVVKTCVDRKSGEKLALKVIDKSKTQGAKETKMIENEVMTMRKIQHPNCVRLYDVIDTQKELFLVMELIPGGDLFDRIVALAGGKYAETDAIRIIRCMAKALNFMHTRGFIHRDLKPENLLVVTDKSGSDSVKLADFGLSMHVEQKLFTICGTPTYVAPEIISEPCEGYGLQVDMWATGVIAYIILCGFPPFASPTKDQKDLFRRIRAGKFSFPNPYWQNVSGDAKDLIRNLLKVDPAERYTAAQVLKHPWIMNAVDDTSETVDLKEST